MDFSHIFIVLVWLWIARFVVGAAYGIILMRKSSPGTWDWQDQYIAGLPFWIGYGIGSGIKWITKKLRR